MADHEASRVSLSGLLLDQGGRRASGRPWRLLLGLALGAVLLAILARGVDLQSVETGLRYAEGRWVGLALVAVLTTTAAKIGRWVWLFPETQRPGVLRLSRALLVGQLINALLPARVGDLARAYTSGGGGGVSRATALGTIAAEKAFDVLFLLICAGLTAGLASLPPWLAIPLGAVAALGGSILVLAVFLPEERILTWIDVLSCAGAASTPYPRTRWTRPLPGGTAQWLEGVVRHGLTGLAGLRSPRKALLVCAWSLLIWALAVGTNYVLFRAFDLRLSVGAALLLLTLLHAGTAPPTSPGRLGVFHALTVVGLGAFGVDRAASLAYATVLHAVVYVPQIVLGSLALALGRESGAQGR